ncbi:MAG TPA: hypothetical protein VF141_08490 [Chryseolinea sp.]
MTHQFLFKRKVIGLLFSLWFIPGIKGVAQESGSKANNGSYSLIITPKLHSAGYFPYSGALFNYHPNIELNVTASYKDVGAFVTKYFDFVDLRSPVNYTTIGLFGSVQINSRLKVTPYAGYFFAQKHSFMDKASDLWAGLVIRLAISEYFWIENTSLINNLLHHTATTGLVNRLNAALMIGKFRLDSYTFYTHSMHTSLHGISASFAVTTPEWRLSQTVSVKAQASFLQQITDEWPASAYERGFILSFIAPIDIGSNKK